MRYTAANHLGRLPNAAGTITRLAYAHAKARGIDTQALLKKANLTLQAARSSRVRLSLLCLGLLRDIGRCVTQARAL